MRADDVERIVAFSGGLTNEVSAQDLWTPIKAAFARYIPQATFHVETDEHLLPTDLWRCRQIVERGVDQHKKCAGAVLVLGHSLGGVIGVRVGELLPRCAGVASIFAPFMTFPINWFPTVIGVTFWEKVPIISFCGLYDFVIPGATSVHPRSRRTVWLRSDHLSDLCNDPQLADTIASATTETFFH